MKNFKKYFQIPEKRDQVFLALTNPLTISLWSGEPAEGTDKVNHEFSIYNGSIVGKVLEIEENKKICQQWYFGDSEKPSIVDLILHDLPNGTSLEVRHSNIPDEAFEEITDGWENIFFRDLLDFYSPE